MSPQLHNLFVVLCGPRAVPLDHIGYHYYHTYAHTPMLTGPYTYTIRHHAKHSCTGSTCSQIVHIARQSIVIDYGLYVPVQGVHLQILRQFLSHIPQQHFHSDAHKNYTKITQKPSKKSQKALKFKLHFTSILLHPRHHIQANTTSKHFRIRPNNL